jgi:S-formylglutathione hydrolase FrmB
MRTRISLLGLLLIGLTFQVVAQSESNSFTARVSFAEELQNEVKAEGRFFLFFNQNPRVEPRTQTWPMPWSKSHIFALNLEDLDPDGFMINADPSWSGTPEWNLDHVPEGTYQVQVLWDQDREESRINAPGNLYSLKQEVQIDGVTHVDIHIDQKIDARSVKEHPLVRVVDMKSEALSSWWGKSKHLKASLLLPAGYEAGKAYPIRYNIAGYGGRYTRINRVTGDEEFMDWWTSDAAPQVINVYLDGEGPFGDSYQMDSDNSGPYGHALIHELIPHIESKFRGTNSADTRFVDGCSTGAWVSLGLQLYYPESFNGCFSYSPDAVEFENYQLTNIYKDENVFVNEFGMDRPVMRDLSGEPLLGMEEFIRYENVLGASGTYLNSGGQFSAHAALYSPKGENGLPRPMFDPETGVIDREVAEHWKKYDFKHYARENWSELGPEIQGKVYVWMGDMDQFYLNPATRAFADFLETTENPKSDAEIVFSPMEGHCQRFSNKTVLLQIQERLAQMAALSFQK